MAGPPIQAGMTEKTVPALEVKDDFMADQKTISQLISLQGKTAIITGAAAGMGAATARRFSEAAANLLLLDVNEEGLSALKDELLEADRSVRIFTVDLADKNAIDQFWADLGDTSPDILVNNAGIFPFKNFLQTDEDFVQRVMDINLNAVYWMCQHFIRRRKQLKQGGAIVNIGSIEAILPFKEDLAHYTTGKADVIALTRALARDYGSKGIRANVVLPGGIMTEGVKSAAKDAWKKPNLIKDGIYFKTRLPLGRLGQPDEVARIILVLVSEMSSYMNGAAVPVDGGFLSA
jgi:NAD(P)-dependent dehydrogenase (short-subunit alcohol dehydrogenase family)